MQADLERMRAGRAKSRIDIALAAALVVGIAQAAGDAPELLLKTLAKRAGPDALDCGTVPLSGNRAAAIACARGATKEGKAYRLALQMKGEGGDTYTWQGAARDGRGSMWVVFYDADTSGGESPGLGQLLCSDIVYTPDKEEVIDCVPSTGGP